MFSIDIFGEKSLALGTLTNQYELLDPIKQEKAGNPTKREEKQRQQLTKVAHVNFINYHIFKWL